MCLHLRTSRVCVRLLLRDQLPGYRHSCSFGLQNRSTLVPGAGNTALDKYRLDFDSGRCGVLCWSARVAALTAGVRSSSASVTCLAHAGQLLWALTYVQGCSGNLCHTSLCPGIQSVHDKHSCSRQTFWQPAAGALKLWQQQSCLSIGKSAEPGRDKPRETPRCCTSLPADLPHTSHL